MNRSRATPGFLLFRSEPLNSGTDNHILLLHGYEKRGALCEVSPLNATSRVA